MKTKSFLHNHGVGDKRIRAIEEYLSALDKKVDTATEVIEKDTTSLADMKYGKMYLDEENDAIFVPINEPGDSAYKVLEFSEDGLFLNKTGEQRTKLSPRLADLTPEERATLKGDQGDPGDSAVYDPSSPDAPDFVMANTTGQSTTKAMTQKAVTDELNKVNDNMGVIREENGWVESNVSATHLTDGTRKILILKVKIGDIVKVKAQNGNVTSGVLVSTLDTTNGYWAALKEDNTAATSRFSSPLSGSFEVTAPASAKYLVINAKDVSGGVDYTPEIFINGRTPYIASEVKDISTEVFGQNFTMYGNNTTLVSKNIVLQKKKRYRISLGATSWPLPSLNNTDYVLSILSMNNDSSYTVLHGVQKSQVQSIQKYYDIDVPAISNYIRINFRATSGYELDINVKKINNDNKRYDHGENLWIESDGSITNVGTLKRYFYYFVCDGGDSITITPGSYSTSFAFVAGGAIVTFNGNKRTAVTETVTITAPDNVDYIAIGGFDRESYDYSPSSVIINGVSRKILIDSTKDEDDVRAYGALGDGAVDDAMPLNRAFAKGGNIKVPKGTYLVSKPITVHSHSMVIMDKEAKIMRKSNSTALCVMRTAFDQDTVEYNGISDFTLIGGTLDMNVSNTSAGACLAMCHASNVRIERVTMQNARNEYHTIDMGSMKNVKIIDCVLKNPRSNSQYAEMIQIDLAWQGSHPYYSYPAGSACWDKCGCDNVEIRGCEIYLSGYNPAFGNHNPSAHTNINIHDNVVYGPGKDNTNNPRGCFAFTTSPYYDDEPNKSVCLIHHNIINDCRYIVRTHEGSESHLYIRDNIFKNFVSVKQSESDTGIELLNNIEINEE